MMKKITGAEFPIMKIFSSEFDYHIPAYQRPYAWTEEEAGTLFDDLYDFYLTQEDDNYFLGSIVLIKEDNNPHSDVIDGQQRLTTLTILLAALASHFEGENLEAFRGHLREPGNVLSRITARPRLHLRSKDQDFFEKYIQNIRLKELLDIDPASLDNEAQKNIQANTRSLLERIKKNFNGNTQSLMTFGSFIVLRCYLVVVYTASQPSAFRVFSVMNSRGLDLLTTDIVKADIIGSIPESERDEYTEKWEDLEVQTSRDGFNDVFSHTRMIYAKSKAKRTLLEEFREHVLHVKPPKKLIDEILEPYAEAYTVLKRMSFSATKHSEEVNEYLMWLNKIDNSDWMPPAIRFHAEHANNSDYVLWFVKKLERLAAYLHITAKDVNARIERYGRILNEMDVNIGHNLHNPLKAVELADEEKDEFQKTLAGEIYKLTSRRRNYLILRLDSFVSAGGAFYDPNILTIEHVLPQTVNSDWDQKWPDLSEREFWLNRIANLVPLTRRQNSEAQNFDFDTKKKKYFAGRNGTSSYALTTQVLNAHDWTVDYVKARQLNLLDTLRKKWEL